MGENTSIIDTVDKLRAYRDQARIAFGDKYPQMTAMYTPIIRAVMKRDDCKPVAAAVTIINETAASVDDPAIVRWCLLSTAVDLVEAGRH